MTRQMLSMIEHGKAKPSVDLLTNLAGALDCGIEDLHGEGKPSVGSSPHSTKSKRSSSRR